MANHFRNNNYLGTKYSPCHLTDINPTFIDILTHNYDIPIIPSAYSHSILTFISQLTPSPTLPFHTRD